METAKVVQRLRRKESLAEDHFDQVKEEQNYLQGL